jgi:hypothetical protein
MEESNRRVLQPWRYLYPLTVWDYNSKVRTLDAYLIGIIRRRRLQREAGQKQAKADILDRILAAVEVGGGLWGGEGGPDVWADWGIAYEAGMFLACKRLHFFPHMPPSHAYAYANTSLCAT